MDIIEKDWRPQIFYHTSHYNLQYITSIVKKLFVFTQTYKWRAWLSANLSYSFMRVVILNKKLRFFEILHFVGILPGLEYWVVWVLFVINLSSF